MRECTVIHVPHASTAIPPELPDAYAPQKLAHELAVMTDWFCDELFACGREVVRPAVSRLVCDTERFRSDADESMSRVGMGAVYVACSDGAPLRRVDPEERERILRRYYDPHHRAFARAVGRKLEAHGRCLIVDGHSFPAAPLPYEADQRRDRPDFCIGSDPFHTPRKLVDALRALLERQGYSVAENAPFAGTIVPMQYYRRDKRVFSVMLEVNRALYLDAPGRKNARFPAIRALVRECVRAAEDAVRAL